MFFAVCLCRVITSKPSTPFVSFCHDVDSLKTCQESVICRNLSETLVNSFHDVAKIMLRKFPAVEIRGKNIGNFRSNQKQILKC